MLQLPSITDEKEHPEHALRMMLMSERTQPTTKGRHLDVRQSFKIQPQNQKYLNSRCTLVSSCRKQMEKQLKSNPAWHPLVTTAPWTYLPLAACLAVILSSSFLPIWRSCLPSMEPVCTAFSWSQNVIWPFKAATASSLPSGRKATTRTVKNLTN